MPILGKVKLATFSGNLYDGITISVNAVVASGSITLGVQSYNGVDWETVNAGLSTSFTGQINTNGPVRVVPSAAPGPAPESKPANSGPGSRCRSRHRLACQRGPAQKPIVFALNREWMA